MEQVRFLITGVHHPLRHLLIRTKDTALPEHLIHQRSLAMIDVCNDRNIPQIFSFSHAVNLPIPAQNKHLLFGHRHSGDSNRFIIALSLIFDKTFSDKPPRFLHKSSAMAENKNVGGNIR